ncbi:cytochrome b5 domain-containing protein 1 [Vespula pensylvanica]|uniref:Cytochrome b5 domain-containing protein 1 n=1 Tax=Vespula pensylvanica TaxID=30213 RepID=A0A834PFZ6_VESPE|nr:cytochrome b5 domain-containing protein 1 [Vespula pensylvanica]KAF7439093.1 hypothetical protein H0235_001484 [Vespula pensylvanica]
MSFYRSESTILIDYKNSLNTLDSLKSDEYFLPTEVAIHNKSNDCWVSCNGVVYDLTDLCKLWLCTRAIKPIIAYAGKDISHWFDHNRDDIKYYIHPVTGVSVPYCPHGPIPDVSDYVVPSTDWRPLNKCPWWLDEKYKLGKLTKNPRPCRIINVLTKTSCVIMVCEEDTIKRIQERASLFIPHGQNYSWTFEGKDINLDGTLTENNIPDERERFVACGLPEDYYVPSIMCYYIDEEDLYESD